MSTVLAKDWLKWTGQLRNVRITRGAIHAPTHGGRRTCKLGIFVIIFLLYTSEGKAVRVFALYSFFFSGGVKA